MSPLVQMDVGDVKRFIYERVLNHPRFKAVVAVSVEKYPAEFSAVVWVAQEPDAEMRQYLYDIEAELANLAIPCRIGWHGASSACHIEADRHVIRADQLDHIVDMLGPFVGGRAVRSVDVMLSPRFREAITLRVASPISPGESHCSAPRAGRHASRCPSPRRR